MQLGSLYIRSRRSTGSEGVATSAPLYATVALGSLYTAAKDLVTFMNDVERYWPIIVIALIFIVAIILIIIIMK